MKTILALIQDDDSSEAVTQSALAVARTTGAHVHFMQVTPHDIYIASDGFGGTYFLDKLMEEVEGAALKRQEELEARLAKEDVPWDFETICAERGWAVVNRAALADLVVLSRKPHRLQQGDSPLALIGRILHDSPVPLLIPGDEQAIVDPGGSVVVAWDGTAQAANAVRAAAGLIAHASTVKVIRVEEKEPAFPDTAVLEYLSRYGVKPELEVLPFKEDWLTDILVARARDGYIVMGGYSHSRLGEWLFGGATRALLRACPIGLFVAH